MSFLESVFFLIETSIENISGVSIIRLIFFICLSIFFSANLTRSLIVLLQLFISKFFKLKFEKQLFSKTIKLLEVSLLNIPNLIFDVPKSIKTFKSFSFIR